MRWLLILLVVLLQVQAPAMAQAAPDAAAASCHDMAAMDHGRQDDGQDQDAKMHQGKAHLCPGCSIPGTTPAVEPLAQAMPCAPVAAPLTALDSRAQPPSLPPPRQA